MSDIIFISEKYHYMKAYPNNGRKYECNENFYYAKNKNDIKRELMWKHII